MFSNKNLVHILTIMEAAEKCFIYKGDINNAEEFFKHNDQLNYNACVTLLIAIGEESKSIEEGLKLEFPNINWKAIAGMRNIMAHNYRGIDPEMVFEIIAENLSTLKECMLKMLQRVHFEQDILDKALNSTFYTHLAYLKNGK